MKHIIRIPRKLKKKLKKQGIDWRDYLDKLNSKIDVIRHLDRIFDKDYTNTHEIVQNIMRDR